MAKKLSPFEEAFKEARAKGEKTFPFNGKSYSTATADDEQKRIDKKFGSVGRTQGEPTEIQAGTRYVNFPHTPTPSNAKARSLVDQGRGVQLYKDVDKEAVLEAGLGMASMYPVGRGAKMAYEAARRLTKKDSPASSKSRDEDPPLFKSESKPEKGDFDDVSPRDFKKGGTVSGASKRADGCAQRGKTKGRFI
jgi:hypothetical protein